ncbi:hypothetical protein [Pseudomonas kermanshahensis]|uniref:hypothetical protein n=1 Tax=Pseudomonas kermanshahensis TaxID=2745482 RepID=UPI002092BF44|nr:hypothetical protein [Pseudomonas kermanshahensis]USS54147.1 hypothetical protein NG836_20365 [Pseudomonas kermanshahensis]
MALKLKKVDSSKNAEARWEKFDNETQVQLMPLDNQQYQIALERMRRRLARNDAQFGQDAVGVIEGEKSEHDNHCLLLASFIVQDWQGAQDENGNPLAYSENICAEMLRGDSDFFYFVLRRAAAIAADNRKEQDEIKGKQSPASNGSGNGASEPQSEA